MDDSTPTPKPPKPAQADTGMASRAWLCPECHNWFEREEGNIEYRTHELVAPTCDTYNDPDDPQYGFCGTEMVQAVRTLRETITELPTDLSKPT